MSLAASVSNGKIVDSSAASITSATSSGKSSLNKDDFLQLLVAQMKYQDPLEPTSNTEYVAQLATFSQLEELQNMDASNAIQRANDLVGKPVIIKSKDAATGGTTYSAGYVDAVKMEDGKPCLYINGSYYSVDDVDTVLDKDYFTEYLKKMPKDSSTQQVLK